jgi:hypothetical protein
MSLVHLLLAGLGVFALLHFLLIPLLRHRLRVDRSPLSIRRAALMALLGWLRGAALVATLTTAALAGLLFLLLRRGGTTVQDLSAAVEALQRWRDWLEAFGPYWSGGVLVTLVLALGIYAYRSGKKRLENAFRLVYEQQMKQIVEKANRGELEELPPTPEMAQLAQAFQEQQQILANVRADASLPLAQRQMLETELERRLCFCRENWLLIDMHRRLDLKLDPDEALAPPPRTWFGKVQTFLISEGLLVNLNRGSRLLYHVGLVSLVVCLVGVQSAQVGPTLSARILDLDGLRVRLSRDLVQREWEQAKAEMGPPGAELAAGDEQVLNQVAAQMEQAVCRAEFWRHPSLVRPSTYLLRSLAVQDKILHRVAQAAWAPPQQPRLQHHASMSRVADLPAHEKLVIEAYEHAVEPHGPVTKAGQRFLADLKDTVRRTPTLMERLRGEVRLFQQPARGGSLGAELTTKVVSVLTGAEYPEAVSLCGGFDRRVVSALMDRVLDDHAHQILTKLAQGTPLNKALHGASAGHPERPLVALVEQAELRQTLRTVVERVPRDQAVLTRLRDHPPGVDVKPEPHVNVPRATAAVERFQTRSLGTLEALARARGQTTPLTLDPKRFTTALASYGDELPAQLAAERNTVQGKLLAELEKKVAVPKTAARAAETNASQLRFLQGRDFNRVRGFHRVGGVLIGREPTKMDDAPELADLRWEMEGPYVRLILTTADGHEVRSRPHPSSLVYLALAYAADGRTVAVTIADAYPLGEHTILLHPTLVDTSLGRRVIELDQFIQRYTRQDERQHEAVKAFYAQHEFYHWAWGRRLLALPQDEMDRLSRELRPEFREQILASIREAKEQARQTVERADPKLLAEAWKVRTQFGAPVHSPWVSRKRHYDEKLLSLILRAAATAGLEEFTHAFDTAARSEWLQLSAAVFQAIGEQNEAKANRALREVFFYGLVEPPTFGLRHIVREQAFAADPSRIVLREGSDPAVPFDFFLQLVFTSEPYFAGRYPGMAEDEDDRWWEFAALSPSIQDQVHRGAAGDERARTILADVAEFTHLQRLFRAIFQGRVGEGFPVDKLLALTEATAPAAPSRARTLRWDMREGPAEVVAAVHWLQVLGHCLPQLDAAWQPTWLDRLGNRRPLEEADFAKVLGEWSTELGRQLSRLPGNDAGLSWCRTTLPALEQYRLLMTEAAEEHRRFKQATDRLVQQRADSGASRKEWEAFATWQTGWGRRWGQVKERHPLRIPENLGPASQDKAGRCVEALQTLIRLVEQVHAAREIRQELGVAQDERQMFEERLAPLAALSW